MTHSFVGNDSYGSSVTFLAKPTSHMADGRHIHTTSKHTGKHNFISILKELEDTFSMTPNKMLLESFRGKKYDFEN